MAQEIQILEKGIIELLPQIPYVIDQVGKAMEWAKEEYEEGTYYKNIEFTLNVAKYVTKISEPKFYKTHLVVAALLMDIPNVLDNPKFEVFKTPSKSIENTLENIVIKPELNEKYGCFKGLSIHAANLARVNQEYLAILLYSILSDLEEVTRGMEKMDIKTPITAEDYVKILGYSYVMQNLKLSKFEFYNETKEIVKNIGSALNSINF